MFLPGDHHNNDDVATMDFNACIPIKATLDSMTLDGGGECRAQDLACDTEKQHPHRQRRRSQE